MLLFVMIFARVRRWNEQQFLICFSACRLILVQITESWTEQPLQDFATSGSN